MCHGLAIIARRKGKSGWEIKADVGEHSHEALGADDHCIRLELLYPSEIRFDFGDQTSIDTLVKNGVISRSDSDIGRIPQLPEELDRKSVV